MRGMLTEALAESRNELAKGYELIVERNGREMIEQKVMGLKAKTIFNMTKYVVKEKSFVFVTDNGWKCFFSDISDSTRSITKVKSATRNGIHKSTE